MSAAEVTRWENPGPAARIQAGALRLVEWAHEADAAYTLAQKITSTAFCPEQFRGKPADAAAAMLAGGELGLSPLAALSAFDVIQGRAAARALTLRALAQSRGHEIVLLESTTTRCRMKGRRAGSSEWQSVTWTIDRAKDLGLTSKPNWRQQPQTMLVARATSEIARLVASDALLGIGGGYSSEEMADGAQGDVTITVEASEDATAPARRVLSRPKAAAPADDVPAEVEPEPEPEPEAPVDVEPITTGQMKALQASYNDAGITERDDKLRFASETIGRDLASAKELTRDEASQVIDALKAITADPTAADWGLAGGEPE